jgi:hypothetical protein
MYCHVACVVLYNAYVVLFVGVIPVRDNMPHSPSAQRYVTLPAWFIQKWCMQDCSPHLVLTTPMTSQATMKLQLNDTHGLGDQTWWDNMILPMFSNFTINIHRTVSNIHHLLKTPNNDLTRFLATCSFINHQCTNILHDLVEHVLSDGRAELYAAMHTPHHQHQWLQRQFIQLIPIKLRHNFTPNTMLIDIHAFLNTTADVQLPMGLKIHMPDMKHQTVTATHYDKAIHHIQKLLHKFKIDAKVLSMYHTADHHGSAICGGTVVKAIMQGKWEQADVDVFVFGTREQCIVTVSNLLAYFAALPHVIVAIIHHHMLLDVHVQTKKQPKHTLHIQIVLKYYSTLEEVLGSFDLDCCAVAFVTSVDNQGMQHHILGLHRAYWALQQQVNILDVHALQYSTMHRAAKYNTRGFMHIVPMSGIQVGNVTAAINDASMLVSHQHRQDFLNKYSKLGHMMAELVLFHTATLNEALEHAMKSLFYNEPLQCPWRTRDNHTLRLEWLRQHPQAKLWFNNTKERAQTLPQWNWQASFQQPCNDIPLLRWKPYNTTTIYRPGQNKLTGHIVSLS